MARDRDGEKAAVRLAFFYLPNGLIRKGFFPGESDRELPKFANQFNVWRFDGKTAPVGSHPLTFTPTLAPLHPMREKISLLTGLDRTFQNGTDSHAQAASCYLTSSAPYTIPNSAYPLARTLDHVAAETIGKRTPFTTLELSCNDSKDNIESIYFDNMSWYGPGHVAPSMRDPRQVYDRLFSTRSNNRSRNITDLVLGNARSLQKTLGKVDRQKFAEYFDSIRSIETRMDKMDRLRADIQRFQPARPSDHFPRNEYIHIMGDMLVTALQAGLTNVGTFRAYLASYLKQHPNIHREMTFLTRQLAPSPDGIAIEIYVFSNDTDWVRYEAIQSDIFDHVLAVLPLFDLRVFQAPTGADMRAIRANP